MSRTRRRNAHFLAVTVSLLMAVIAMVATPGEGDAQPTDPPNVVLVMLDDMRADSLGSMPWLSARAQREAAWFVNAYASLPQCCPSRATVLTGRYVHNHDVWKTAASDTEGLLGGHAGVIEIEDSTIATWLDDAGYTTALFGKYTNGFPAYSEDEGGVWAGPPGWDEWAASYQPRPLVPPATPVPAPPESTTGRGYTNFALARGGDQATKRVDAYRSEDDALFRLRPGDEEFVGIPRNRDFHSTKTLAHMARSFVTGNAADPFMVWLNFVAPHVVPVPTAANTNADVPLVDRTQNGYVENSATQADLIAAGKPAWVRELPAMDSYECDAPYSPTYKCVDATTSVDMERDQLRTLLDVDRQIRRLFKTLETVVDENGVPLIDSTYVIVTSDHGFMWGEHRIPHNKGVPYEESIAVPFLVFGPDVDPGRQSAVVSLIDVAPTIVEWAGLDRLEIERTATVPMDGESLIGLIDGSVSSPHFTRNVRGGVLVESRQRTSKYEPATMRVPGWETYVTARWKVIRYDSRHVTVREDPEGIRIEGYDLKLDSSELQSLYTGTAPPGIVKTEAVMDRMAQCAGTSGPNSCSIPAVDRWSR